MSPRTQRLRFMLYEPAELLKAANAMAEAEATKQTSIDEMVISLTRFLRLTGIEVYEDSTMEIRC